MSGILSQMAEMQSPDDISVVGYPAIESEIVLEAIRSECASDNEFATLMESASIELGLYGVIDDADVATEAAKRIVVKDWKTANFNRIVKRTSIRMAMVAGDSLYSKYKMYRDKLIDTRDKIYIKYGNKAKVETKKILANARNKAAAMDSKSGRNITEKMDRAIANAENK